MAQEKNLDLVEINPKADPPIVKIMSFGQFKYKLKKQEKSQRHSAKNEPKGIRLSPTISQHDMELRLNQAEKFLSANKKIKIEMRLQGREKAHSDLAFDIMKNFVQSLLKKEIAEIEQPPKRIGAKIISILKPQWQKQKKQEKA